ncbi:MAG TPA: YggT family protein [Mycobacteriales bacterium]|nr:YggT family protein [Mycobacteriales bacterium]
MLDLVESVIITLLNGFLLLMLIRWVVDLVMAFMPDWRPKGFMIVVLELTYTVTDPPLRFLRRFIPPLRMGRFSLDLSFILLLMLISIGLIPLVRTVFGNLR